MNDIQKFTLNMTKEIISVFEKNNIFYVICSGSLLGAIRHKGFIPWDDDIDIMIPAKEYKKAIKILKKQLSDKYFVQNYHTEKKYNLPWTQIRANGTTSMPVELTNFDINYGICIDLFPVIGLYNNRILNKLQLKLCGLEYTFLAKDFMLAKGESTLGFQKIINKIPRVIRHIIVNIFNLFVMKDINGCNLCTAKDSGRYKVKYPSYYFMTREKYSFEDTEFYGIKEYDKYLSLVYGDYMKLPPMEKRCGHQDELGKIIYDLNKDYSYYKSNNCL
mgnify:FL=1